MFFKKKKRKIISIEGINNEVSAKKIEEALENLVDVSKVKIKLNQKVAIVTYDNTLDEILLQKTIEKLGYTITGIKEDS